MEDYRPARNGFRIRGAEMTRLEVFVDAAFAFTLTMLVISFDEIPDSFQELADAMKGIPAFAASFAIVCMLWVAHRQWSQRFGLEDVVSTLVSFALVFVVMIYVFPLRVLMAAAVSAMTGGWAPSDFRLSSVEEARLLLAFYGAGFAAANACIVALNLHALRIAAQLRLDDFERFVTRATAGAWAIVGAMGIVSVTLAALLPGRYIWLASWSYSALAVIMPAYGIWTGRMARRYESGREDRGE